MELGAFDTERRGDIEHEFSADEHGFELTTPNTRSLVKWDAINRVDNLADHVLLWRSKNHGYYIPKRAFATPVEAEAFANLAKEKTVGKTL